MPPPPRPPRWHPNPVAGRLGGTLTSVIERFGPADYTEDGLIRYDALDLNGLTTILVVYHDEEEVVTRLALVYLTRPETLITPDDVLALAATVAPADGECQPEAAETSLGAEVYPCHSVALMTVFDAEAFEALDASGGFGDYSVAVDPLFDDYFEILIVPGSDGTQLDPGIVEATSEDGAPVATPTLAEQYPPLEDPTALMDGDIPTGEPLSFTGEIKTLQIAEFGTQFRLGVDESLGVSSLFQIAVPIEGSTDVEVIFVGYNGDATTLAIGDQVTVYGANYGTQCFDNALEEEICQPLIAADLVEK